MAYSGVLGGVYNVLINLKDIKDEAFVSEMKDACSQLESDAKERTKKLLNNVESRIKKINGIVYPWKSHNYRTWFFL